MKNDDDVLDEQALQLLGEAPGVLEVSSDQMQRLRDRVMRRVDDDVENTSRSFFTIRADDGPWVEIAPGIQKKVLFANSETGTESYLLKAEPGAEAPPHPHEHDEHCMVLEGEVIFGNGIHLRAGDYHFAPGGSEHAEQHTDAGVLVYIQTVPRGMSATL